MPIYEYECSRCNKVIEAWQSFSDSPLAECPECAGPLKKLISMSSFQLKGGGWYADGYASRGCGKNGAKDGGGCAADASASSGDKCSSSGSGCSGSCPSSS